MFLIDALGAVFSMILLGLVLPLFENFLGLPAVVFRWLAVPAALLALYSFSCYIFSGNRGYIWLRPLMAGNAAYCLLTAVVLVVHRNSLTIPGLAYFMGEMFVIFMVIRLENESHRYAVNNASLPG